MKNLLRKQKEYPFVVGIGASAGGVSAIQDFFSTIKQAKDICYIVFLHSDPSQKSILNEIISQKTPIPVVNATSNLAIKASHIYIVPENSDVKISNNQFAITSADQKSSLRNPIDQLFIEMANAFQDKAIAVVLSGSGNDGSQGCIHIKKVHGIVATQALEDAKFNSMPKSANIASPSDIIAHADCLNDKIQANINLKVRNILKLHNEPELEKTLTCIFELLKLTTTHDFSSYKKNTLLRRIKRRMNNTNMVKVEDYATFLARHEPERFKLMEELLIGVTEFFRDGDVWKTLKQQTLPTIFKNNTNKKTFRAWIAGCASGEEVYSLAFLLYDLQQKDTALKKFHIQIFASDLNQHAIEFARKGTYPQKISSQFSEEQLNRYFTIDQHHYIVKPQIRELIVFAHHNLLSDPPYTQLDFISCRNVMIYMSQEVHQQLFKMFHYCLNKNGYLLLGTAESIDNTSLLFSSVSNNISLYMRQKLANDENDGYIPSKLHSYEKRLPSQQVSMNKQQPIDLQQHFADYMQKNLSPAAILVNNQGQILNIIGDTSDFLTPMPGKAGLTLHAMAKTYLNNLLQDTFHNAQESEDECEAIFEINSPSATSEHHYISIKIEPFEHKNIKNLWLIAFQNFSTQTILPTLSANELTEQLHNKISFLEKKLLNYKSETQFVKEEMQTSREELMSTNEELQSTNEELTTSTEELRTMNEQLIQARQQAEKSLIRYTDLFDSAPLGYFTLNKQGRILNVNSAGKELLAESIDEQVGSRLGLYIIEQDRSKFLAKLDEAFTQNEAQNFDVSIWRDNEQLRYVTLHISSPNDNGHCRVIINDITDKKIQQRQAENKNKILALTAQNAPLKTILTAIISLLEQDHPQMICSILLVDESGKHLGNSVGDKLPDFYRDAIDGVAIGDNVGSCGTAAFREERVIVEDIQSDPLWQNFKELAAQANLGACWSQPIIDSEQKLLGTFAIYHNKPTKPSVNDIELINHHTILAEIAINHYQAHKQLKMASLVFENSNEASMVFDEQDKIIAINPAFSKITGYSKHDVIGKSRFILHSNKHNDDFYKYKQNTLNKIGRWQGELWGKHKDGHFYAQWMTINTIYDDHGNVEKRVALFFDITEKKKSEEIIWQQANYDSLTNLPNRRMFFERLKQETMRAHRDKQKLAVMLIDLDNFKEINDVYGHDQGDKLLIEVSNRIKGCIRQADTLARLGGDEFTIIVTEVRQERSLELIAQQIIDQLQTPITLNDNIAYITASIGITVFPDDSEQVDILLKHADQAMYQAKENGKNIFCYFTSAMQYAAEKRLSLVNDLRNAIKEQQFSLYFQPIVGRDKNTITKAEVLVRWLHPQKGIISPDKFIPLAEETGLIVELGDWIFKTAALQLKQWQQTLAEDFSLSINVSPVQFRQKDNVIKKWLAFLKENQLPCKNINIEITEGLLLDATDFVKEQLTLLAQQNISVSLDDFGTGYSSLSYLKKLDIDYLKIDKSFVDNLAIDENDQALCQAIIVMAHQLSIKVIAEGVETKVQHELLSKVGCDFIQGYFFAKPMPSAEFENFALNFKQIV